jgi:gluconolactonase
MKHFQFFIFACLCFIFLHSCKEKEVLKSEITTTGKLEVYDQEFHSIIDTSSKIEVLSDGFTWSEGPLWLASQNKLIFTDVPTNIAYSWDETNGKQVYLSPSGYTNRVNSEAGEGANGLMLDSDGSLILCQHGNRAVAKMLAPIDMPKDSFEYLATEYKGKKFNSPNDLYITKNGDLFFTDPPYGLKNQDQDSTKELSFNGVYRLKKDGNVILLDSTMTRPNGIVFSSNEKLMYVANSDPEKAYWKKFEMDENKNVIGSSIFSDVTHLLKDFKGLPDGMKINKKGYIFATGPGGVLVFNQNNIHLGTIMTGNATANCALDADEKYLYMTAHNNLMRIKLK